MLQAKFFADPLKAVAVHKELRNRHTDRQTHTHTFGFITARRYASDVSAALAINYILQLRCGVTL